MRDNNLHLGSVKQQLALYVLRICTKPFGDQTSTEVELVPEHIETRTLHDPSHPGFPQVNNNNGSNNNNRVH